MFPGPTAPQVPGSGAEAPTSPVQAIWSIPSGLPVRLSEAHANVRTVVGPVLLTVTRMSIWISPGAALKTLTLNRSNWHVAPAAHAPADAGVIPPSTVRPRSAEPTIAAFISFFIRIPPSKSNHQTECRLHPSKQLPCLLFLSFNYNSLRHRIRFSRELTD